MGRRSALHDAQFAGRDDPRAQPAASHPTTGDSAHLQLTRDDGETESVALSLTPKHELIFGEGADAIMFVKR